MDTQRHTYQNCLHVIPGWRLRILRTVLTTSRSVTLPMAHWQRSQQQANDASSFWWNKEPGKDVWTLAAVVTTWVGTGKSNYSTGILSISQFLRKCTCMYMSNVFFSLAIILQAYLLCLSFCLNVHACACRIFYIFCNDNWVLGNHHGI